MVESDPTASNETSRYGHGNADGTPEAMIATNPTVQTAHSVTWCPSPKGRIAGIAEIRQSSAASASVASPPTRG